jgi:anthranilate phosphoribosyltransferase
VKGLEHVALQRATKVCVEPWGEEVAGAWEAIRDVDTIPVHLDVSTAVMDNCGTGRDHLKTFNISTAASVMAAAGGVTVARHGARAITSRCGTVDVAEALGVDVEGGVEIAKRSVEGCGLGLFNGTSRAVHPRGLFRILPQIRLGTTLHLAGSLASPAQATLGVGGLQRRHGGEGGTGHGGDRVAAGLRVPRPEP